MNNFSSHYLLITVIEERKLKCHLNMQIKRERPDENMWLISAKNHNNYTKDAKRLACTIEIILSY